MHLSVVHQTELPERKFKKRGLGKLWAKGQSEDSSHTWPTPDLWISCTAVESSVGVWCGGNPACVTGLPRIPGSQLNVHTDSLTPALSRLSRQTHSRPTRACSRRAYTTLLKINKYSLVRRDSYIQSLLFVLSLEKQSAHHLSGQCIINLNTHSPPTQTRMHECRQRATHEHTNILWSSAEDKTRASERLAGCPQVTPHTPL